MIDLNQIQILRNNCVYRVGDVVCRGGIRWKEDRRTILTDPKYKHTILYDYLKHKTKENDIKILKSVVWKHIATKNYPKAEPGELVIHIRLGDFMSTAHPREQKRRKRAQKMYNSFLYKLPDSFKLATIVTAMHFGANEKNKLYFYDDVAKDRSFGLFRHIEKQLRQRMEVKLKSSANVDEDFAYMVSSRHFVKGQTRFSELIAKCLKAPSKTYDLEVV
jgi:hypothetical protein